MNHIIINTPCYFDGLSYHTDGPYQLLIKNGQILSLQQGPIAAAQRPCEFKKAEIFDVEFLMPGLVEAHCHLFLNGGNLNFNTRSTYLKASMDKMLDTAHNNVNASMAAGITLIRDAGDKYGVNHRIREIFSAQGKGPLIRSPGIALRQTDGYGAFMAKEIDPPKDIYSTIKKIAKTGDDLKILLTGIIDFKAGAVTKPPQFNLETLKLMVSAAADNGIKTFVHCSGLEGLKLAVAAGVDSIEHGFFMNEAILDVMAKKKIAWVPTFSPVHFQGANPDFSGWSKNTIANIKQILDDHLHHIKLASEKNVQLVAGSDAGSYGVCHGTALIDELYFFLEAGLTMGQVLESATSRPRRLWGCTSANIIENNAANFIALGASPFDHHDALRDVKMVMYEGSFINYDRNDGANI